MRLKSLSLNLTPTTFHDTHYATNQTPVYYSHFQLTSPGYIFTQSDILQLDCSGLLQLSGLQRTTSIALLTCPMIASTNYFALAFPCASGHVASLLARNCTTTFFFYRQKKDCVLMYRYTEEITTVLLCLQARLCLAVAYCWVYCIGS